MTYNNKPNKREEFCIWVNSEKQNYFVPYKLTGISEGVLAAQSHHLKRLILAMVEGDRDGAHEHTQIDRVACNNYIGIERSHLQKKNKKKSH